MEQTISLNLTKKSIEKFSEVFNNLEILDSKDIDILIIVNIRNKLKIRLLSIKDRTFTIDFTKEEFLEWIENVDDTNWEIEKSDYKTWVLNKL